MIVVVRNLKLILLRLKLVMLLDEMAGQGLEVGGSVQSLGQHTTKSVVQALFAIIVIDAFFALFYQELGI